MPTDACGNPIQAQPTSTVYTGAQNGRYSENRIFAAGVSTSSGAPVTTGNVTFIFDDRRFYSARLDASGTAQISVQILDGSGDYFLTARYEGDTGFQESQRQIVFHVDQMGTACRLQRRISNGKSVLDAVMRTAQNRYLVGGRVSFYYNNRGFITVTTDRYGVARTTAGLGTSGGRFTARLPNDSRYVGCTATATV